MRANADLVVVGAGIVAVGLVVRGTNGAEKVTCSRDLAGQSASSRAAGMVRAQSGTPTTVALSKFSIDFYNRQRDLIGTDSGFRELGNRSWQPPPATNARAQIASRCSARPGSTCAG